MSPSTPPLMSTPTPTQCQLHCQCHSASSSRVTGTTTTTTTTTKGMAGVEDRRSRAIGGSQDSVHSEGAGGAASTPLSLPSPSQSPYSYSSSSSSPSSFVASSLFPIPSSLLALSAYTSHRSIRSSPQPQSQPQSRPSKILGGRRIVAYSPNEGPSSSSSNSRWSISAFASPKSTSAHQAASDIQAGSIEAEGKEGVDTHLFPTPAKPMKAADQRRGDAAGSVGGEGEEEEEEEESATSTAYMFSYFVAGGAAGAASRTIVSPLERLKIIMQVQPRSAGGASAYDGIVSGLAKMWREEGFAGYMRGNGINVMRIFPYSAIQFCTYEFSKEKLRDSEGELDTPRRLLAGALAGTASCVGTFPLDLVRARISIASANMYADAKAQAVEAGALEGPQGAASSVSANGGNAKMSIKEMRELIAERQKRVPGIWVMTSKVYREEGGVRGLFRGCVPSALGIAPYCAINFAVYESFRQHFLDEEGEISTIAKLCCGASAGGLSQTITYPLDVLRRRMQVAGMKNSKLGYNDKGAIDVIRNIVKSEGLWGLYRGIGPNLAKVMPSIGVSFLVYETVQNWVHPHHRHPHHHHGAGNGNHGQVTTAEPAAGTSLLRSSSQQQQQQQQAGAANHDDEDAATSQ